MTEPTNGIEALAKAIDRLERELSLRFRGTLELPKAAAAYEDGLRVAKEARDALRSIAAPKQDAVERVARFITPTVLRYIPDYDEVPPEHVWTRPRYEWLTFAMIQIANAAISALRDEKGDG